MTFKDLRGGPIVVSVGIIFVAWLILTIGLGFIYGFVEAWDTFSNMDPNLSEEEQQQIIQDETDRIVADFEEGSTLRWALAVILLMAAGITFLMSWITASRNATSPEQAVGYGVLIGAAATIIFFLCMLCNLASQPFLLLVWAAIPAGGALGGKIGGRNARPRPQFTPAPGVGMSPSFDPLSRFGTPTPGMSSTLPPGSKPETFYNMGIQAALGGRREEARQHFTRVLQMQPRSIAAWLQLANLADTPEQAWNYIQQARSIDPTDPAVMHAVSVIWPKVAASVQQNPPARLQPPYTGGAQDDSAIPRTTLPNADQPDEPPPADVTPPADDFWGSGPGNESPSA